MSAVLITGAFGFVGGNLSRYLAGQGHTVWALDVPALAATSGGAYERVFSWDALADIPWSQIDAVIHLAGKAHDTRNASDPESYFEINAGLTRTILDACVAGASPGRARTFILFSTMKAVADQTETVLDEQCTPNPQTPYGRSKLEAEQCVFKTAEKHADRLRGYVLRPCMIHGPGNKGNFNLLYNVVCRGIPWPLGAYENQRSFASIPNVCAVVEGLLTGDVPAGIYQVADDEPLATNAIIRLMAEALQRRARIMRVSPRLIRVAAKMGDALHLPLNSERLRKLTESYVVSNAKIKEALHWKTMPVSAIDGMRSTLASFTSPKGQSCKSCPK